MHAPQLDSAARGFAAAANCVAQLPDTPASFTWLKDAGKVPSHAPKWDRARGVYPYYGDMHVGLQLQYDWVRLGIVTGGHHLLLTCAFAPQLSNLRVKTWQRLQSSAG